MRIVVLSSSLYSETACATAAHLSQLDHVPVGVLALRTLDPGTLIRKFTQWGPHQFAHYARKKLSLVRNKSGPQIDNPYLAPYLSGKGMFFCNLKEVANAYEFEVATCSDHNSAASLAQLRRWSPDLIVFAGGNILRKQVLQVPQLGVLNMHLALLPEIRGMSGPEWSLLNGVPVGITIHCIDAGIDTGPILQTYELPNAAKCQSVGDLRRRLIAFGIEKLGEIVVALSRGAEWTAQQVNPNIGHDPDRQFFVMHEWLQARAAECFAASRNVRGELNG